MRLFLKTHHISGERAIGSLAVGDTALANNPATRKSEPEPVQRLWRNDDHDLVDVHLTTTTAPPSDADPSVRQSGTASATSRLQRWVRQGALAAGLAATLLTTAGATAQAASPNISETGTTSTGETIHTTANHPWLTSDHG